MEIISLIVKDPGLDILLVLHGAQIVHKDQVVHFLRLQYRHPGQTLFGLAVDEPDLADVLHFDLVVLDELEGSLQRLPGTPWHQTRRAIQVSKRPD